MAACAAGDRVPFKWKESCDSQTDTKEAEVPSAFQHFGCLLPDLREDLADLDKIVERVLVEPRMKSKVRR